MDALYWLQVIGACIMILGGLVSIYIAIMVRELHVIVNSRLTELLERTGREQRALGDAEGSARERERAERAERD